MKVSVSLPEDDVKFLDEYARSEGLRTRSAVLHKAVRLLRGTELGAEYEEAFASWHDDGSEAAWDVTASDGL